MQDRQINIAPRSLSRQTAAEGMLLITTIIWGGTFGSVKLLLDHGMGPIVLLTWRFGIAALLFGLFFFAHLRRSFNREAFNVGVILGLLLFAGFGLQTVGLTFTSSSRSGFITALYVVITPLLQIFFGRAMPRIRVWISVAIVTLGLWLLTSPAEGAAASEGFGIGDIFTLGCAVSFAFYIIVLDRRGASLDPIPVTATQLAVVALLSTILFPFLEPWTSPPSTLDWGLLLYLALLATVFTTWCQARYQPRTTPSRAAIIYSMESVFAAIVGVLLLNEEMRTMGYVGGGLIVAGLLLVETGRGMKGMEPGG